MPGVDIEDGRQASWPLNSFDSEIGSSHIDAEPQAVEASKPVPTALTCSVRLRWIKASLSFSALHTALGIYLRRWKGAHVKHPARSKLYKAALAWLGCFLSILLVGGIFGWVDQQWSLPLMLASFGPTAALLYGSPKLPAAQPWNAMGGTIMSGLVGLLFRVLLGHKAWIARPLAVATSVGLLAVTASPFPPGAATALLMTTIAPQNTFPAQHCASGNCYNNAAAWCIFSTMEHSYLARLTGGCRILLANVMGQVAMVVVALLVNNLDADPAEGYPCRWL
ncbi:hypothetical protein WJX77_007062 [Trebouxia sp. C0004]